ncbi:MAG: DUF4350 domain-containing protein [Acidobacteria bacterium]|nr:DUF4350 domain-containing protein [Acidobacteriota bacterium]MCA1627815.1 DUF4350 domain-containing protein [Acidobacteriota bacterium]
MRQRLTIILTFVVIIGALVILNTITYVKEEQLPDSEVVPNRSTYHSGPTGTRALHDFLSESGYKVMRWRDAPEKLLGETGESVATFVVIGSTRLPFSEEQLQALRQWIARGGCFVLIDREPIQAGMSDWSITALATEFPAFETDPADATQMTENVTPAAPVQPTGLTHNVSTILPSRFASRIMINPATKKEEDAKKEEVTEDHVFEDFEDEPPPPPPAVIAESDKAATVSYAPVVHIADKSGALLVDYLYGRGRVLLLSDPYIVTNTGIRANDNLQLAINVLTTHDGLIAFDEYHQGRGITRNAFASYFSGTPVLAIAAQIVLLVLLVLWTNARRFGRPLPLPYVDRRSSLEFVASMAELQERSRAFDLAIENIYARTRRVLARYAGVDYNSPRSEIAARVAARSNIDAHQLETLMRQCEDTINGEPIHWRQAIDLVKRLRAVERKLGLRMRTRDARQAAENI